MYEVVYMKADFEPWWMFEEWRDYTVAARTFSSLEETQACLDEWISEMKEAHEKYEMRKGCFHAFWSAAEMQYCDNCEGDAQIYHGIIVLHNGKPLIS